MNGLLGRKSGASRKRVAAIRGPDGQLLTNDADIARAFREHYAKLASADPEEMPPADHFAAVQRRVQAYAEGRRDPRVGPAPAPHACPVSGEDVMGQLFGTHEVQVAMQSLRNGKAVHDDGIPNELIVYGGGAMAHLTSILFNVMLTCQTAPAGWRLGTIISLFKAGDRSLGSLHAFSRLVLLVPRWGCTRGRQASGRSVAASITCTH